VLILYLFETAGSPITADNLNAHDFANIATDPNYSRNEIEDYLCSIGDSDSSSFIPFSDNLLTTVLNRIRSTSPGPFRFGSTDHVQLSLHLWLPNWLISPCPSIPYPEYGK